MADRDIAAFGLFPDRASMDGAINLLCGAGFRNSDVSILTPETPGTKNLVHGAHTRAPEGAAAGATAGAVVGGVMGWLIGIGALAVPGIGPFIAAGPIVAFLAGVGAAGAAGGLIGALVDLLKQAGGEDVRQRAESKGQRANCLPSTLSHEP